MESRSFLTIFLALAFLSAASAFRVTSGSPCASTCGHTGKTRTSDMTCLDHDIDSKADGQAMKGCYDCLQNSTYSSGGESDQQWLLYNLRSTFDFCVFGYPNATGIGVSPCVTSEACGGIEDALLYGITNSTGEDDYGYCDVEGHQFTAGPYQGCLDCVAAEGSYSYVTNFLIALDAGCQQRPTPGFTISLNETIFSKSQAQVVEPGSSSSESHGLATKYIVAITVCSVAFALAVGACVWYSMRRYKKKQERKMANRSALSFYCNTQMSPDGTTWWYPQDEYYAQQEGEAEKTWGQQHVGMTEDPNQMYADEHHTHGGAARASSKDLTHISTMNAVPEPEPVHTATAKSADEPHFPTPTTTTSYYSNAPLLRGGRTAMSDFAASPGQQSISQFAPAAQSPMIGSPLVNQTVEEGQVWQQQQLQASDKGSWGKKSGKNAAGVGTPVETSLQTSFPPPPKR